MKTEMVLFFEMLHQARAVKEIWQGSPTSQMRRCDFLAGYRLALRNHLDDIKAGQNIADVWAHQRSGAE